MPAPAPSPSAPVPGTPGDAARPALLTLISVFFFWGFVAASNTILIPLFKAHFTLAQWESQLVDSAYYAAYFFGSLLYFVVSLSAGDPLNRFGYKKGLVAGLAISAVGALGMIPAAGAGSFGLMLASLFVIALGFALQQIVANPYVIVLGPPESASTRSNFAQGINSLGTTLGPLVLAYALFGNVNADPDAPLDAVKLPYGALAVAFLAFAGLMAFSKLPPVTNEEHLERGLGALRYPQLVLGMLAIFVYVGTEVSIQSNLPRWYEEAFQVPEDEVGPRIAHFISLYWGSLMIGRWTAGMSFFNLGRVARRVATVVVPFVAYAVVLLVNAIKGSPMNDLIAYAPFVLILVAAFFVAQDRPARTMLLFGVLGGVMMLAGLAASGKIALYCLVAGGLFCSVMWPNIFALSIAGLGRYTSQGAALLVMMILGGALIPPLQGYVADVSNIHISYLVPLLGFAYLAAYGVFVGRTLRRQGVVFEQA